MPTILRHLTKNNSMFVKGQGIYLIDSEGKQYIDGSSGSSLVCNIGHGVKEIAAVMTPQAEAIAYNPTHCSYSSQFIEMAEKLVKFTPKGVDMVFGVNGGSEATETALKFARQYQVARSAESKYIIISRWQSYHGNTIGSLSCSGHTYRRRKHTPYLKAFPHIPPAFCYRCYFEKTYPECNLKCARALENAIRQEGPENVSVFIAEPVVGASLGAVPAPDGYFNIIREICDKYDVLFVADEVMSGLGRTGANFAIDHWNVKPDMIATAKGMGGGYFPVGACIISSKITDSMEKYSTGFEGGHTHSGHLQGCKVACAVLDYVSENKLVDNSRVVGTYLIDGLREMMISCALIGDVRGKGLMCGIEFVKDRQSKEPYPREVRIAEQVMDACMDRGLIVFPGHGTVDGVAGDHLLIGPPLTITTQQVDELLRLLKESILMVEKNIRS
jgi:adenosylmethionine-8-amino-7-oxononanoate aminotransferase